MGTIRIDGLIDQAAQFLGHRDFGDSIHVPALEALTGAFSTECPLEDFHVPRLEMQLVHFLVTRAKAAALRRAHPEIDSVPVRSPIVIMGMPRTGTTMLHNLLSRHPDHWAPPLWQLQTPIREEASDALWEQNAVMRSELVLGMMHQTIPELAQIHPMNPRWPDECSFLFRPSFATMVNAFTYRIPSYARWLLGTDMAVYYQAYKKLLQILLWQHGGAPRLVLKDPCHLWHLSTLLEVFPDAKVLFLHRRIDEALPSFASLCFAFQRHWTNFKDPASLGPYCLDLLEQGLLPAVWARRSLGASRVIDVSYRRLVGDPRGTLAWICQRVGASTEEASLDAMAAWLGQNPQHKAGKHAYTLEQFGYRKDEILERFQRYHQECLPEELGGSSEAR